MFAIIGVSAHLANALPDADSDASADMGGAVISLGTRRSLQLCWLLLAVGTGILIVVSIRTNAWLASIVAIAYLLAVTAGTRSRQRAAKFHAVITVVVVNVTALVLITAIAD
jgi:1,4-dihydroxy-2-naphthoate octaprenyltransferase